MLMVRIFFTSIILVFYSTYLLSQQIPENKSSYFQSPLDIPLYLSGNFGELRSAHFHAGIDLKTQGTEGHDVFAAAEGYISRIKIQTGGYGRSLYISHPNGLTTVYGHLQIYSPKIEEFIKAYQYRNKTHTLDLYLKPEQFPVNKGEIIALSGNTGGSGGPHLHFEIRETATQDPRNGLLYNFDIKDNIPPQIRSILIYNTDNQSFVNNQQNKLIINAAGNNGKYNLTSNLINVFGNIGFGIETYDYLNGSSNRCGIYSIEMRINSVPIYLYQMNSFSFAETGAVDSHVDYSEWKKSGRRFHKVAKDPNNKLSLYQFALDKSGYSFVKDSSYNIEFIVKDSYQNTSTLQFTLKVKTPSVVINNKFNSEKQGIPFSYEATNYFEEEDIKIKVPYKGLYDDITFEYSKGTNSYSKYSSMHHVHNVYTPVSKRYDLKIKPTNLPVNLWGKAIIIRLDKDNDKDVFTSKYDNGFISCTPNKFGRFYIDVDTLSPKITPLNIYNKADLSGKEYIDFRVTDDLTGIDSYDGYIDGKWALFEYDPKNNLIRYYIDSSRLEKGKEHTLQLNITDGKENKASSSFEFYW